MEHYNLQKLPPLCANAHKFMCNIHVMYERIYVKYEHKYRVFAGNLQKRN